MARISYILKKDGRFWLQKRFVSRPGLSGLRPTHLRLCLRTADYRTAVSRMLRLMFEIQAYEICPDLFCEEQRLRAELKRFVDMGVPRSPDELLERRLTEVIGQRHIEAARLRRHATSYEFWPLWRTFIEQSCDGDDRMNTWVSEAYERGRRDERAEAASRSAEPPAPPPPRCSLPFVPAAATPPTVPRDPAPFRATPDMMIPADGPLPVGDGSRMLSEVTAIYFDQLAVKNGDRRAEEDAGIVIRFLIDMIGDKPVCALSADDLLRVEEALPAIPDRGGLPRASCASLHARWSYGRAHGLAELKPLSKKRLRGYHMNLNSFLDWLRARGLIGLPYKFELIGDVNLESQERDAWSDDELIKLFSLPLFTGCMSSHRIWMAGRYLVQDYTYWGYVLTFMLGLRPSEVAKLQVSWIILINGVHYIDIKPDKRRTFGDAVSKLKTKSSARRIPIPQLLVDLGLIGRCDDLRKAGEKMLFPEAKIYGRASSGRTMWGHSFSKSWQYIKRKFNFDRPSLTLYGGRHTRAGWYDALGVPMRVRDRLMGHARRSVADMYGPNDVTDDEAQVLASRMTPTQARIAEILLEAKLRSWEGELITLNTWTPAAQRSS